MGAPIIVFLAYFKAPQPFGYGAFCCLMHDSNRLIIVCIDTAKHSISNKVTRYGDGKNLFLYNI